MDRGANYDPVTGDGAHIMLWKRAAPPPTASTPEWEGYERRYGRIAPRVASRTAPSPPVESPTATLLRLTEQELRKRASAGADPVIRVATAHRDVYAQHVDAVRYGPHSAGKIAARRATRDALWRTILDATEATLRAKPSLSREQALAAVVFDHPEWYTRWCNA